MGPVVEPIGLSTVVGGSTIASGNSGGAGGSGASGSGDGPSGSPSRDSTRGKSIVVEGEVPVEVPIKIRAEDVMFRPAVGSSSHRPVTKQDVAKYLSDEGLTRLLEENPDVRIAILIAREEREREIVTLEAAARVKRERVEGEEALRDAKAAEIARVEKELPRVPAMTMAAGLVRAPFSATTYVLPTPHLFVLSGFPATGHGEWTTIPSSF
ncbi:hypothetical protein RHMOL_Rhmol05G0139400 [Rhododendron molle]|uniref:Uncharacterized protein n=1 Tax=Rhododendron molle TaxID=49168 RepID=A0ACC0NP62_RHOML|nr:hypothetical protein RHMOL_Rhmol05G0139400 [Rhododendron molle]